MSHEVHQRMQDCLQLNGLSAATCAAYLRAVRLLFDYCRCRPEDITE